MHVIGGPESRHGGDHATGRAERGEHAGMHDGAVDHHRTGAAVACVAALLHVEVAVFTQERAQALPWPRIILKRFAVHDDRHDSSTRTCSASSKVMALRQSG